CARWSNYYGSGYQTTDYW
nr:immunoglobulin heavy chain junction region [Macaca mulatta]